MPKSEIAAIDCHIIAVLQSEDRRAAAARTPQRGDARNVPRNGMIETKTTTASDLRVDVARLPMNISTLRRKSRR